MRYKLLLGLFLLSCSSMSAQNEKDDFDSFRKGLLNRYQGFRKKVLDDYDKYLADVWKRYDTFVGEKRNPHKKPVVAPDVNTTPPQKPKEDVPTVPVPKKEPQKEPQKEPCKMPVKPTEPTKPTPPPVVKPTVPDVKPVVPPAPSVDPDAHFMFYGVSIKVPKLECVHLGTFTPDGVSKAWREYNGNGTAKKAQRLKDNAALLGLNDWFTYEMVRDCVKAQFTNASSVDRMVLVHYLMVNMGYDVRLAKQDSTPLLLLAIDNQVYETSFLKINGRTYYVFGEDKDKLNAKGGLYTCDIPDNVELGHTMDMRINRGLNLKSGKTKTGRYEWKDMAINTTVDVQQMEMLRRYPQMDIPMYAASVVDRGLRSKILEQLRPTVQGLNKLEAANRLLQFVQHAFQYATDGDQHGYEKSYFVEENFYYPKNDCEDRAIFYAFLIRNLLDLDVLLIQYPGHECTAVNFDDRNMRGDGYMIDGKPYFICDPTYIGANIGQCMPQYVNVKPVKVEQW